ncbi:hypothetical protein L9F63_028173, partial [Diploptera punctata]
HAQGLINKRYKFGPEIIKGNVVMQLYEFVFKQIKHINRRVYQLIETESMVIDSDK